MPKRRDTLPTQQVGNDLALQDLASYTVPRHRRARLHADVVVKAAQGTGVLDLVAISGGSTTVVKRIAGSAANQSFAYESSWLGDKDSLVARVSTIGTGTYEVTIMEVEFNES